MLPPPLKPDSASPANFQALTAQLGDSCSAPILEPDRSRLLQEALADSQLQAVRAQLESRGFAINTEEAQAVQLVGGEQLLIPFGDRAHLVWTRTNRQTAAVGLVRQGKVTVNITASGEERIVRFLPAQKVERLLSKLREKSKFQQFEGKLAQRGKRVGQVRALFDETNKIAILGIAPEGNAEKIAHQVRIKVKAGKDDEPEDDAEPVIQATACGQVSGEAVALGVKMEPLTAPGGEWGDFEGGYEGPQICTSQWGYDYLCTSTTPQLSLSLGGIAPSLALPQTFINQQTQASFVIWNYGGGRLSGTVSVQAPFSIVSGASFSLAPGQPQEVVVRFSSATAGSFSKSITISSNGGNKTVTATSVAHKVSFSPAPVDCGSGLLVMTEQCDDMGACGVRTEKVGLPIEKTLTVKNEGSVAVSLTLSASAPYKIVSVLPTLSPGQSGQVTVRFDPNESGTFTGSVQVGLQNGQGSVSVATTGVAHKIEPTVLNFGIVFVGGTKEQTLTVKNQGVMTVPLTLSVNEPFSVGSESSFTLAPSETRKVRVQLSPTASGDLQGKVRLTSGMVFKELPVTGGAYTEEEYREILKQSILATCQAIDATQGVRNIYFVPGYNRDFLFYRMPCPTDEELDALLELLMALENQSPTDGIVPEQFGDPENIIAALNELLRLFNLLLESLRNNPNATPDDINRILESFMRGDVEVLLQYYPGFREFYIALTGLGPQLTGVIRSLAGLVAPIRGGISVLSLVYSILTMQPPIGLSPQEWQARQFVFLMIVIMAENPNGQAAMQTVIRSNRISNTARMEALQVIVAAGIATQVPAAQGVGLNPGFYNKFLEFVAIAYGPNSLVNSGQLQNYMNRLVWFGTNIIGNLEGFANSIGGFIAFVGLAQDGWMIVRHLGGFALPDPGIHVIANKVIDGREVAVFIHVEAKLGVNEVESVADMISDITTAARRFYAPDEIGIAAKRVTVLIAFNVEPGAVDQLVTTLEGKNLATPVLILYPEGGEWKVRCVGDCSSDQKLLDEVARAISQALGTPYSGGSENSLGQMLSILDQAMAAAEYFYGYGNPAMAWHLAFGVCGNDLGCILFLAEALIRQAQEECGNQPCARPMALPPPCSRRD